MPSTLTTNWSTFLTREPQSITDYDWTEAVFDASCWTTCACGDLCSTLPRRGYSHAPVDSELFFLGGMFTDAIRSKKHLRAQAVFIMIECRATVLLQQQNYLNRPQRSGVLIGS